jgi:hypothetical protein
VWFLGWSLVRVQQLGWTGNGWDLSFVGRDFWIYRNAAVALISGGDPWAAFAPWNGTNWHFAAPPTAAQFFVPFAWLDASVGLVFFVGLSAAMVLVGLRRLGLAAWWLLFPPLTEGLLAANPQILLIGLLLFGSGVNGRGRAGLGIAAARTIAVGLKVYAFVPVVARREWRALALIGVVFVVSVVAAPGVWRQYATEFGIISSRVVTESNGGLSASIFLQQSVFGNALPASELLRTIVGLGAYGLIAGLVLVVAVRDVPSAGWLAAPLLWPAAEYHLAAMAIPIARRASIWLIAVPTLPTYLLGLILLAYQVAAGHRSMAATDESVPLSVWLRSLGRASGRDRPASADAPTFLPPGDAAG